MKPPPRCAFPSILVLAAGVRRGRRAPRARVPRRRLALCARRRARRRRAASPTRRSSPGSCPRATASSTSRPSVPRPRPEGPRSPCPYAQAAFDDSAWAQVDVPHDWAIEGPFQQDLPGETAKLPWVGVGWYRRHFEVPAAAAGRRVYVDFDGAMSHAAVWVNGRFAGGWPYGYASFRLDLTRLRGAGRRQRARRPPREPARVVPLVPGRGHLPERVALDRGPGPRRALGRHGDDAAGVRRVGARHRDRRRRERDDAEGACERLDGDSSSSAPTGARGRPRSRPPRRARSRSPRAGWRRARRRSRSPTRGSGTSPIPTATSPSRRWPWPAPRSTGSRRPSASGRSPSTPTGGSCSTASASRSRGSATTTTSGPSAPRST